jgi:hypothetical protein
MMPRASESGTGLSTQTDLGCKVETQFTRMTTTMQLVTAIKMHIADYAVAIVALLESVASLLSPGCRTDISFAESPDPSNAH